MSNTKNAYALAEKPFYTIQGEGFNTGIPAVFIRFSRCNLNCKWCDTEFNKVVGVYTAEELLEMAQKSHEMSVRPMIVFTGGEPFLQLNEHILLTFYDAGFRIAIESNGTQAFMNSENRMNCLPVPVYLTLSPKVNHPVVWNMCSELKVVLDGEQDPWIAEINVRGNRVESTHKFIQPCSEDFAPAVKFVKENPTWRLSVQTQKILKIQ